MTTTTTSTTTPQAWVGCLGCYNNGSLVGKWLEGESCADLEAAGLAKIETHGDYTAARCVRCGADEFYVLDHEGFGDFLKGECSPIEAQNIAQAMSTIEGAGLDLEAVAAYASNMSLDIANFEDWQSDFEDAYIGEYEVKDYAIEYVESCGLLDGVPDSIARYFDYDAFARDFEHDLWQHDKHLFWNR
jgi:antirestriction protein